MSEKSTCPQIKKGADHLILLIGLTNTSLQPARLLTKATRQHYTRVMSYKEILCSFEFTTTNRLFPGVTHGLAIFRVGVRVRKTLRDRWGLPHDFFVQFMLKDYYRDKKIQKS